MAGAAKRIASSLGKKAAEAALKAEKTARDRAIIEAAEASKRGFLNPSKDPERYYHGTTADINDFRDMRERGFISLTKDPEFASGYAMGEFTDEVLGGSPNVMPVRVQTRNPFDYENPEHIEAVLARYKKPESVSLEKVKDNLELGNWNYIEDKNIQQAIKDAGFDAFYMKEYGVKNLGVFDPKRIKSDIGMQGAYDITTPEITQARGGAIDQNLINWHKKMAEGMAAGGSVSPEVMGGGTGIPYKKGGKVENAFMVWAAEQEMAAGGTVDSYQRGQAQQAQRSSDIQAYKEGRLGADQLIKHFPGMTATMVEAQLNPEGMKAGGEVRMQKGGDPSLEEQIAAGVPLQGPEADAIRARRLAQLDLPALERSKRVSELPLLEKFKGGIEAAHTIKSVLGQEIAKPFVGLFGGEKKIKELEEGMPLPESEAGIQYLTNIGEFLQPVGKAIEASKLPQTPLTELTPVSYLPGLGRQLAELSSKAARKIEQVTPESLKNLPVGASIKPVGEKGEKVSVNELIRRLEAGEEMTPEDRQKAEYSKAQKEKYAAANIARQEKEPAPAAEKVKVPADELGFYDPIEKAAVNLARNKGTGETFLNDIKGQPDVSPDLLESIGLDEWLKSRPSVTKQEVIDYVNDNKIKLEEVTRGTILSDMERQKLNDINRRISRGFDELVSPEEREWFEATREKLKDFRQPLYESDDLILPGGKNYRELLLKIPGSSYKTSHFPDDPGTFAWIRAQEFNINNKKTLLIEEVQSDLHQEGRELGYLPKGMTKDQVEDLMTEARSKKGYADVAYQQAASDFIKRTGSGELRGKEAKEAFENLNKLEADAKAANDAFEEAYQMTIRPPDAPFKDDWYQVALRRAMKYAADNDFDQVALVGADKQIERYQLSRKVDAIEVKPSEKGKLVTVQIKKSGDVDFEVDKNGVIVDTNLTDFKKSIGKKLSEVVGKPMAKRLMEMDKGVVSGGDLDIGGKGMRQYYDQTYPKFLEKQYGKYGAKPEKKSISTYRYDESDVIEVETGEADRFGREMMAYKVVDPNTQETVAYEYDFDDAIDAANKAAGKVPVWVMDVPAKLKADVKIGQPYKKGGLVSKSDAFNSWAEQQEMAGGGVARTKRAVERTVKAAEKAAAKPKRMSREEAEKAGLYHPISDIKLQKPLAEVQVKKVIDPESMLLERTEITPEDLYGGASVPMFGDRTETGMILKELEGIPMDVVLEGGGEFMRKHPGLIWASHPDRLEALGKKVRMAAESGRPVYGVHSAMGPQSADFSTMVTETILSGLDVGSLRKEDINAFNQAVKAVKGQGGKPKAPNFPGLEDPELKEKLMSGPGGQRDAFIKAMDKKAFVEAGFPSVAQARYAVTAPQLLNVERGASGFAVGEFDPQATIEVLSGHKSYPADIRGQYKGALSTLLPVEHMYPTHYNARRLMGATHDQAIKSIESQLPIQYHDQEWLDNAMQYLEMQKKLIGRKKGGLAQAKEQ